MFRFVLLFSYIIPISLRVNLDMGKAFYSWQMQNDPEINGTVVRSTTIPEELGRISYLLTDKTGTLTQNEMVFKKIHLGTVAYGNDSFELVASTIQALSANIHNDLSPTPSGSVFSTTVLRRPEGNDSLFLLVQFSKTFLLGWRVWEAVKALALCHNVTPVYDENDAQSVAKSISVEIQTERTYQASSPDEIALVKWTEQVGLALVHRDLSSIILQLTGVVKNNDDSSVSTSITDFSAGSLSQEKLLKFQILQIFPFTSESKRMGIIVKDTVTGEITFYLKGADIVMTTIGKTSIKLKPFLKNKNDFSPFSAIQRLAE